ncbi:condensin complex protein MksE [Sulfurospirillum deleyianum]|uniref:Uncharacterized protein n=1 Tax=Sulfurospirillum deleyianum (strain ATCC 51133 / DSM 6946 / 5175) TaxID=525898 RepID=D1B1L5_SULD5|nr:hypothetical protein [Sulfurospirillum deleyianum]ACZ11985.1 hypothetical protein Sdel_0955 [Sulfurospirillum deleyianum DSM 6946]
MDLLQLYEYKDIFQVIEDCRINGKFINENSTDFKIKEAYNFILQYKQDVKNYYHIIGYTLVTDVGFFYFILDGYETIPKPYINNYIDYIDMYRFLKLLNSNISSSDGGPFSASDMESRLNVDIELQTMIYKMNFLKKRSTHREAIDSIIARLKSDGFAESIGNKEGQFFILRSFKFIEDTIDGVEYEL